MLDASRFSTREVYLHCLLSGKANHPRRDTLFNSTQFFVRLLVDEASPSPRGTLLKVQLLAVFALPPLALDPRADPHASQGRRRSRWCLENRERGARFRLEPGLETGGNAQVCETFIFGGKAGRPKARGLRRPASSSCRGQEGRRGWACDCCVRFHEPFELEGSRGSTSTIVRDAPGQRGSAVNA